MINSLDAALRLRSIIPPGIYDNSGNFVEFLKAYYDWLHTSTFDISSASGNFVLGENIVGTDSKAVAKVLELKTNKIVILVTEGFHFHRGETITGQTSSTTATIDQITDNVLRTSANLLDYRDVEKSVDKFADYLKYELYSNIPNELAGNKLLLKKKIRDFYLSKSQESAYSFLFKSLFNEDIEISYPGEQILRVSDGKFVKTKILRATVTSNIFDFLFKTVRGQDSNAIGDVVDIKLIYLGALQVAEMTVSLVNGTFEAGETISVVGESLLSTTLYGIVADFTISDGGTGYNEGDYLAITGDGTDALVSVNSVYKSPIRALKINSTGYGYRLNTYATVDNTGTDGSDLIVKVTGISNSYIVTDGSNNYTVGEASKVEIINRGTGYRGIPTITLVDNTIKNIGLLHENLLQIANTGNSYAVGDWLTFTSAYGANANAIISSVTEANTTLLLEDNSEIHLEDSYYLKNETATLIGAINRVKVTNYGSGYAANNLPTISINTSTGSNGSIIVMGLQGTGANVEVDVANNVGGLGSIRSIDITNFGVNYSYANVDATVSGDGNANVSAIISGIGISSGAFSNDDGKVDYKIIQDSYYYQDFSYVIKSGLEISTYRDIVKNIIHPSGLEFFGEISILNEIDVHITNLEDIINVTILTLSELNLTVDVLKDITLEFEESIDLKAIEAQYLLSVLTWGTIPISYEANTFIYEQLNTLFASPYYIYGPADTADMNIKIDGTVSTYGNTAVSGNGTSFTFDFVPGSTIIIGTDALIVSSVVSPDLLYVVVDSDTIYTNSSAYKIVT